MKLKQLLKLIEGCGEKDPVHTFALPVVVGPNAGCGRPGVVGSSIAIDQHEGLNRSAPIDRINNFCPRRLQRLRKGNGNPEMMPPRRMRRSGRDDNSEE